MQDPTRLDQGTKNLGSRSWKQTERNLLGQVPYQARPWDHGWHSAFYPQAFAPASQVVKGSDPIKLKYNSTYFKLEYKIIRSMTMADEAQGVYSSDNVNFHKFVIQIQPLFTLGSVYSTSASGAEQTIETK